ncbi:amino acid/amide ABC transporter membrane protein 2 (HAAT family) [Roseibium hamelinense]|uniref:Amino acid/amide ABC transporter membrane protein 2 (HAAT family) n=1 Tax=Roseibium hamelinense TaxID=150831 RepID=A0A562SMD5_9HYPH|nr:branched-chain amino acid ABC transporter permease [Roseibium hamelinense]MTI45049.1 branched-chain amino acid ABC transporter permease [Roseibium hamelinense]TWI82313.1 amino acid/amide ABC transporter membrane protein 2 (HAAT family) [Roseibium hamelinense]
MFYREAGQFKTSYEKDQALFPIRQDKIGLGVILLIAFVVIPLTANDFFLASIMIPFLVFSLAAIGLNVLTGFCGQLSLGTGAFMGVGAYAAYKLTTIFPDVNVILLVLTSGIFSAIVGAIFGLPSLRIKGLYLAVTTLAAQFFLEWCFIRIGWLYNYNASGAIEIPTREMLGVVISGAEATPLARYFVVLSITVVIAFLISNVLRGRIGRSWMMIRDMDIAAELMGIRPLQTKLMAFAVSSYICGVAGAMMVFFWLNAAEPSSYSITLSFQILFMVILGGLGSVGGAFMGAAFIWILPIVLRAIPSMLGVDIGAETVEHLAFMVIGALIIFFLIVEPHGFARLWQIAKQKLRVWPFPY